MTREKAEATRNLVSEMSKQKIHAVKYGFQKIEGD
jgi:hypothetical protein